MVDRYDLRDFNLASRQTEETRACFAVGHPVSLPRKKKKNIQKPFFRNRLGLERLCNSKVTPGDWWVPRFHKAKGRRCGMHPRTRMLYACSSDHLAFWMMVVISTFISIIVICLLTNSVLGILIWNEWLGPWVTGFLGLFPLLVFRESRGKACELRHVFALGSYQALCLEGAVGEVSGEGVCGLKGDGTRRLTV